MIATRNQLETAWWPLKLAFFAGPFLAGLDKFFHLLTNWDQYVSPLFARWLPVAPHTFMLAVGVIEMAVGIMVLTRWTRIGAYVACAWLACIIINLVSMGQYLDVALRDVGLALCAFGLARLTAALEEARAPRRIPSEAASAA